MIREANARVVETTMSPALSAATPIERPPAPGSSGIVSGYAAASADIDSLTSIALAMPHSVAMPRIHASLASVRRQPSLVVSSFGPALTPTTCTRGAAPPSIQ